MRLTSRMVYVMVFGVIFGLPSAGRAQEWRGGYVSGHVGMSVIPMGPSADNVVLFDTNLDGTFDDTVRTAAGANAFSPGFCAGDSATALPSGGCTIDDDGIDFGVRGGYDWQRGRFVVGAVADLAAPDHVDSVTAFSTTPAFYTFTRELSWLSGFRGRAGAGWPRMLIYGTGGAALGKIDHRFATSNAVNTFVENAETTAWGYQLGGGAEFKLGRMTFGGEYLWTTMLDEDRYTVRAQGPAPATNPFILSNASGTDLQRADRLEFGTLRFTVGLGF